VLIVVLRSPPQYHFLAPNGADGHEIAAVLQSALALKRDGDFGGWWSLITPGAPQFLEGVKVNPREASQGSTVWERDEARAEVERLRADRVEILADMVGLGHTVDMMRPVVEAAVAMTWDEPSLRRIDEAVDAYLAAQGEGRHD
jgi:hypothetical protein